MSDIDVIIPAFNAERTVAATIDSVLRQTSAAASIVVVDDGSTDRTAEIAACRDGAIRVVRTANGGQGAARAVGAGLTSSEFALFLDADDLLLPTALERLAGRLADCHGCVVAYCRAEVVRDPGVPPGDVDRDLDDAEGDVWARLLVRNFIRTPGCALIRRSSLNDAGGWDADAGYCGHEDWDLWIRLAALGPFAREPDRLLRYRVHAGSFSTRRRAMQFSQARVIHKYYLANRLDPARRGPALANFRAARSAIAAYLVDDAAAAWRAGAAASAARALCRAVRIWPRCVGWPARRLLNAGDASKPDASA
jgi:glycosyltransferase involved in cell wall biosynthesis